MIPASIHLQLILLEPTSVPMPADIDRHTRYELVLPLDRASRVDLETWSKHQSLCIARRLIPGREVQTGKLGRAADGILRFNCHRHPPKPEANIAPAEEIFAVGEHVPLEDEHGRARLYRVVSLERI